MSNDALVVGILLINSHLIVPVHNSSERIENAALFLRLGLPSKLIRHERGIFRKQSRKRSLSKTFFKLQMNLQTPTLRFIVDGKRFENRAFRKRLRHDNLVSSARLPFSIPFGQKRYPFNIPFIEKRNSFTYLPRTPSYE